MNPIVTHLAISNFRSFGQLEISPFGRVNLITGKNNSGKSSLLEAIRILVTEGSALSFYDILNYREEAEQQPEEKTSLFSTETIAPFCSLFSGYPPLAKCSKPILIKSIQGHVEKFVSISIAWFTEEFDAQSGRRYVRAEQDLFGETSGFPALEINLPKQQNRIIRIDRPRTMRRLRAEPGEGNQAACVFLDPFSSRTTGHLSALWDKIALTDAEKDIVKALQIISPSILAISMIGSESSLYERKAIAKSSEYEHPVPLRSFGDGINRLFGLMLSLASARGGVLLIDEIENGLHHSILPDVWRTVFRVSSSLGVQVFATSHSWDCIEAFQKAAEQHSDEGVLVRLTVKDEAVIPTVFREDDLAIIARDRVEVR